MTTSIDIEGLRTLLEKATPLPWKSYGGGAGRPWIVSPAGDAELGNWLVTKEVRWDGDRELIVAVLNALPTILDEIEKQRVEIERLRAALKGVIRVADRKTVEFDAAHAALEEK